MAGELRATLLTTVKGDAIKKLEKDLGGLSDRLKGLGGVVGKVAKGFAGFATAIGATKFITGSIEQAKLLEQSYRSLETVFGPLSGEMQKFAEGAAKIGLSQTEAAKASIFIGNVLQQYGISAQDAADKTQTLVGLAADLAFVTGYDVQEALLGMTALFRGEYDPIEKFGVAMKQNEIESIKAARGLEKLTGQAELHADVLIREELLLQRTGKSLGAFTDNSDTLAVQTEVLRATFENLQATLGQELSPVIAQFYSDLIPIIEEAGPGLTRVFEAIGEVIKGLAGIFIDLFDPTTNLGNSVVELGVQFESLYLTIFGRDFDIAHIFEAANHFLSFVIDSVKNLIKFMETLIIYVKAWGEYMQAIFEGDWEKVANGVDAIANKMIKVRDATNQSRVAFQVLLAEIQKNPVEVGDTREIYDVLAGKKSKVKLDVDPDPDPDTLKNVKSFFEKLQEEVEKQAARTKLSAMGASEGLVEAILGDGDSWKKTFDTIVKGGVRAVQNAQSIFNRTAAGIKEVEEGAKKALEALEKIRDAEIQRARQMAGQNETTAAYYNSFAQMLEAGYSKEEATQVAREEYAMYLEQRNADLIRQQNELKKAFTSTADEIFNSFKGAGVVQQLGEYGTAVEELRTSLTELIAENPFEGDKGLFSEKTQGQLTKSLNNVADIMLVIANARDKISTEITAAQDELERLTGERKSLFESIVDSIMGNVNITQLGSSSRGIIRSLTRTLEQTKTFAKQIDELRTMGLGETAIRQIVDSGAQVGGATAKALLKGGAEGIKSVNSLYDQIGLVATEIGSKTADKMFESGVMTAQGFLDGLLKQESEFVRAAEYLANAFKQSFDAAVATGAVSITGPSFDEIMTNLQTESVSATAAMAAPRYASGGGTFNINVNAGMGADGQAIGRIIVDEIKRFERQSGRVFLSA